MHKKIALVALALAVSFAAGAQPQPLRADPVDVKMLRGLLPICAWCKKVRDDAGYWNQIEAYVARHSEAEFSHGICPECMADFKSGKRE